MAKRLNSLTYLKLFYLFIVNARLFISWLLTMTEHPPTSINIEYHRKDDDSTLSSRTESHKSTVVTPHKNNSIVLPSGNTTNLNKSKNITQ